MKLILYIILLLSLSSCKGKEQSKNIVASIYPWTATLEVVNDLPLPIYGAYDREIENAPLELQKKLDDIINGFLDSMDKGSKTVARKELFREITHQLYKMELSQNIDLYITHILTPFLPKGYYLLMYNKQTLQWSESPYFLSKVMDENGFEPDNRMLEPPFIAYNDVNNDGINELVIKERVHNGTVYDAIVTHYLNHDAQLNFIPLINIETLTRLNHNTSHYIKRVAEFSNHDIIKQHILLIDKKSKKITDTLGQVTITLHPEFHIGKHTITAPAYKPYTITGSNVSEIAFLKKTNTITIGLK